MKQFIGIDLGTTNSAICSYNGSSLRVWKSPEQNDVIPSVISFDRRRNKYVGKRAYDFAPQNPKNAAQLFKRMMGTNTPIHMESLECDMTPEECSAEILKVLYGYLPEEMRRASDTGTVITVPAAFNQMQKRATREAAQMAGIGRVALMQEPVAAVMRVMREKRNDGMFLIYDFGGGTLDVAVAECIGRKVQLIAHGGIAMCGGRDFDRGIFSSVIRPWLDEHFHLPADFIVQDRYQSLYRLSLWAAEKAKIELSAASESHITLTEFETRSTDTDGMEIFLDIPLTRARLNEIIQEKLEESVVRVREILAQNNLSSVDFEDIIFIGGPTNYKPLRDYVSTALGIPAGLAINPMTAVAEGAAIYAETIDWEAEELTHKSMRGEIQMSEDAFSFNYIARTAEPQAKLAVHARRQIPVGTVFQVDAPGWSSGRVSLRHGMVVTLPLTVDGANPFTVSVYDQNGKMLQSTQITIERTAPTVSAIPASHSIGVEVLKAMGQRASHLEWLVRAGDHLPVEGRKIFKATQALKANTDESINFKLWEGEIEEPVHDNRFIGVFAIRGWDLSGGLIPAGADLVCDYKMRDDGNITIEISVPQIGGSFRSDREFYSRQEGAVDYSASGSVDQILAEADGLLTRIARLEGRLTDEKLHRAREKTESVLAIRYSDDPDTEPLQEAAEKIYEAKQLLYEVHRENRAQVRHAELDSVQSTYAGMVQPHAEKKDAADIESLFRRMESAISRRDSSFEEYRDELYQHFYRVLWQQDFFIIDCFKHLQEEAVDVTDVQTYHALMTEGKNALVRGDIERLRGILAEMYGLQKRDGSAGQSDDFVNIIRS